MAFYDRSDCVAAWLFDDESAGDAAADWSPQTNQLADSGAVQVGRSSGGPLGSGDYAAFTGGISDTRLQIGNTDQRYLNLRGGNFSISIWVYSNGAWPTLISPTILGREGDLSDLAWRLFYDGSDKRFVFRISEDGSAATTVYSDGSHAASTWLHIIVTFDGAYLRMYVDNAEVSVGEVEFEGLPYDNANDVSMGADTDGTLSTRLAGYIDEAAVFTSALTATERKQIYEIGLSGGFRSLATAIPDNRNALGGGVDTASIARTDVRDSIDPEVDNSGVLAPVLDNRDPLGGELDANS